MLNILKEQGIYNIAVFIIRYKDGGNIGKARFEAITELTKMVIMKMPHLDCGHRHDPEDIETATALQKAVTWPKRGGNSAQATT